MAETFRWGVDDRVLYLYDTFEGMTKPSEQDTSAYDRPALETSGAGRGSLRGFGPLELEADFGRGRESLGTPVS